MKKYFYIMIILFGLLFNLSFAQNEKNGTTSANFLKLGAGSRAAAMGASGVAISNGADAIYWNPSLLGLQERGELLLSYNRWIGETHNSFIGFTSKSSVGMFGFGLLAFTSGEMKKTIAIPGSTTPYTEDGTFWNIDGALYVSYGVDVYKNTCFGLNLKGIYQNIAEESFFGGAVDVGLSSKFAVNDYGFIIGLSVNNLGPKIKYKNEEVDLPLMITGGASVRFYEDKALVSISGGSIDNNTIIKFGGEFTPIEYISIRLGYRTGLDDINGDLKGLTAGLGLQYSGIKLDYAYNAYGDLGHIHNISLSFIPSLFNTMDK